jgi:hypothetical protein
MDMLRLVRGGSALTVALIELSGFVTPIGDPPVCVRLLRCARNDSV